MARLCTYWEHYGKQNKIEFNNRAIRNHKSNFMSVNGKPLDKVYTPLKISKTTQFKGLNLCEYKKGEKHFVLIFYMKGLINRDTVKIYGYNSRLDTFQAIVVNWLLPKAKANQKCKVL